MNRNSPIPWILLGVGVIGLIFYLVFYYKGGVAEAPALEARALVTEGDIRTTLSSPLFFIRDGNLIERIGDIETTLAGATRGLWWPNGHLVTEGHYGRRPQVVNWSSIEPRAVARVIGTETDFGAPYKGCYAFVQKGDPKGGILDRITLEPSGRTWAVYQACCLDFGRNGDLVLSAKLGPGEPWGSWFWQNPCQMAGEPLPLTQIPGTTDMVFPSICPEGKELILSARTPAVREGEPDRWDLWRYLLGSVDPKIKFQKITRSGRAIDPDCGLELIAHTHVLDEQVPEDFLAKSAMIGIIDRKNWHYDTITSGQMPAWGWPWEMQLGPIPTQVPPSPTPTALPTVRPTATVLPSTPTPECKAQGPIALVLAFDVSGSMKGTPLDASKEGAKAVAAALRSQDQAVVVPFNHQVLATSGWFVSRGQLEMFIERLEASGDTAIYDAVDTALAVLEGVAAEKVILVFTDGADNSSKVASLEIVKAKAQQAGVTIHVIGYRGYYAGKVEYNPEPMRELASSTGGTYLETQDVNRIASLYQALAGQIICP